MIDELAIRLRFEALKPVLDERGRRRFAAAEARAAGFGGIQAVAQITGIARSTIGRGLAELCGATDVPPAGRGAGQEPGASRSPKRIQACSMTCVLWSSRRRVAIRKGLCCGRPRACATWPAACRNSATASVSTRSAACWVCSATACRPTARRARGRTIPTATPSSATSTIR